MSKLIAQNLTGAPILLAAGNDPVTLPASAAPPERGAPYNVTSELDGLISGDYDLLQAQVAAGEVEYYWSGKPDYDTGSLDLTHAVVDASSGVIWQYEGTTDQDNNTYGTWAEVMVQIAKMPGEKNIYVDASKSTGFPIETGNLGFRAGRTVVVPPGSFGMNGATLRDIDNPTASRNSLYIILSEGTFIQNVNFDFQHTQFLLVSMSQAGVDAPGHITRTDGLITNLGRGQGGLSTTWSSFNSAVDPAIVPPIFEFAASFTHVAMGMFGVVGRPSGGSSSRGESNRCFAPLIRVLGTLQITMAGGGVTRNVFTGNGVLRLVTPLNGPWGPSYGLEDNPSFCGVIDTSRRLATTNSRLNITPYKSSGDVWWNEHVQAESLAGPSSFDMPFARNRLGELLEGKDVEANCGTNPATFNTKTVEIGGDLTYLNNDVTIPGTDWGQDLLASPVGTRFNPGDSISIKHTTLNPGDGVLQSVINTWAYLDDDGTGNSTITMVAFDFTSIKAGDVVTSAGTDGAVNDGDFVAYEDGTVDSIKLRGVVLTTDALDAGTPTLAPGMRRTIDELIVDGATLIGAALVAETVVGQTVRFQELIDRKASAQIVDDSGAFGLRVVRSPNVNGGEAEQFGWSMVAKV